VLKERAAALLLFVGSMWVVRLLDSFRLDGSSVLGHGIYPRTGEGLFGIFIAPFIHSGWPHLFANTPPLLVLGALVLLRGVREFLLVTFACMVAAGAGTWLLGSWGNHIGASGVLFGYVGYLLFRPAFDRKIWSALIALVVAGMYATALLASLIPSSGISWSGHFFGFAGGLLCARLTQREPERLAMMR
jgi:membrane associated rhomboid family serine protease